STVTAATDVAAGRAVTAGVIPPNVAALTEGVLKAMFPTRLKMAAVLALFLAACGVGAGVLPHRVRLSERGDAPRQAGGAGVPAPPKAALRPSALLEQARQAADRIEDEQAKLVTLLAIAEAQRKGGDRAAAARTFRDAVRMTRG